VSSQYGREGRARARRGGRHLLLASAPLAVGVLWRAAGADSEDGRDRGRNGSSGGGAELRPRRVQLVREEGRDVSS